MAAGIQIGAAFFGSLGFALLFNLERRHLFWAALGGAAAWAVYLQIGYAVPRIGIQSFGAALFLGLYSEILARMAAAPATTFLVVGFIPLIPRIFALSHHRQPGGGAVFPGRTLWRRDRHHRRGIGRGHCGFDDFVPDDLAKCSPNRKTRQKQVRKI